MSKDETKKESKPSYWGIHQGDCILYRGTHTECWQELTARYGDKSLQDLLEAGIKIARTN